MNWNLPNCLSVSRIVLSPLLLVTIGIPWLFSALVLVIGVTDIADGYIARKCNLVTTAGARLDSIADLAFFIVLLLVILFRYFGIVEDNLILLAIILALRLVAGIVSKIKYGKVVFFHTLSNKIVGAVAYVFVLLLPLIEIKLFIRCIFLLAVVAATEELLLIICTHDVNPDRKSIFSKESSKK